MATWECMQTVQVYPAGSAKYISCLAVSGSTLVGGSGSMTHSLDTVHDVQVWDLETLEPLHTLKQPVGEDVCALVEDGEEVWGAVEKDVVVWGRPGRG